MGEMINPTVLHVEMEHGLTINEMLDRAHVAPLIREFVVVHINGEQLSNSQWSAYVMAVGDNVDLFLRPAGDSGKEILRLIATIAIIIVAYKLAALGKLASTIGYAVGGNVATGQVILASIYTAVGVSLLNSFIPPPSNNFNQGGYDTGESYFLTNQSNSGRPYQPVPVPYGRVKMIGNLAAQPEVFSAGDSSLFTTLIDWGLGQSNVFNYRAGDTKLHFFQAQIKEHTNVPDWIDGDSSKGLSYVPLELLQYPLQSVELSIGLSTDGDVGIANTNPNALSAVIELLFPQGVAYFDDQGNIQTVGVTFRGEYRPEGSGEDDWLPFPDGTQGYAGPQGEHIWFGQGTVGSDPNPNNAPNISFAVPTSRVFNGEDFVATITFDRAVYAVDFTDFKIFNSATREDVTEQFTLISETEITQTYVWQFVFTSPTLAVDETNQYVITTEAQNFIDNPPPYGQPFPDKSYESTAFIVEGERSEAPDPDNPDPDPDLDTEIYDTTAGNETFVRISGIQQRNVDYVAGDPSTFDVQSFEVWEDGERLSIYYGNWDLYAGVFVNSSRYPAFGGYAIVEMWSIKAQGASGGDFNPRFINLPPGWDGAGFGNNFTIYGNKSQPAKASIVLLFPVRGAYEIRITRIGDTTGAERPQQYVDSCYWSRLASRGYPYYPDTIDGRQSILNLKRKHTMTEIRLEASERVQGNLNEISATVVSQLRMHNGTQWTNPSNSRNPAWIVADILTGYRAQQVRVPLNLQDHGGYLDDTKLDLNSFREFSREAMKLITYTEAGVELTRRKYEIDFILASDAPVIETCQNILAMCRARLHLNQEGKIAILMDEDRAGQVRQVFTPANSWGFSGSRIFQELPHGLRVDFVSPELGYQKGVVEVFRPPYTKATATTFENLSTFGCSNWHMAAQYGMYVFGTMILRTETFTLSVAAESLAVQVGDVVEVASDTAALGGGSHLIVDQTANDVIVISEEPFIYTNPYYTVKTEDGVVQGRVLSIVGRTIQLEKPIVPKLDSSGVGIIVIGEKDFVTKKYIISEIFPSQNLNAELKLVPYDERVYKTDEGEFPEWSAGGDGNPQNPENGGNARTTNLTGTTYLEYEDRQPISVSDLSWELQTADAALSGWEIKWTQDGQDTSIDVDFITSDKRGYKHKYNAIDGEFGAGFYVVTPISQLGYSGEGAEVFVGKSIDRIPPPAPAQFRVVAYPNYLRFNWKRPDCPDLAGYRVWKTDSNTGEEESELVGWSEEQFVWFTSLDRYGSQFRIMATDTSGNDSEIVIYDGLANGIPYPPLVVPFFFQKRYELDGVERRASVNWEDVLSTWDSEPSELIKHYELRWDSNPRGTSLATTTEVARPPHPSREYWLPAPNGYPETGRWYIAAIDYFNQRGPWNTCSSEDKDYYLVLGLIDIIGHHPLDHPEERQPYSEIIFNWNVGGTDADLVKSYRLWFFPRQPEFPYSSTTFENDAEKGVYYLPDGTVVETAEERYLGAIKYYEGTEEGTTIFMNQLPNYQKYHQGTWVIEGLDAANEQWGQRGRELWSMNYDRQGPEAPPNFRFQRNPNDDSQIALVWSPCSDPDIEHYEIRYASYVDAPWETSMIIGQPDFYHNGYDGVSGEDYFWPDEYRAGQYQIMGIDTSGNIGSVSTIIVDAGGVDPNEGWLLVKSIEGHDEFKGTLTNMERSDGITILLDPNTPVINDVQTAFFEYDETAEIEILAETRIVSETLEAYEEERPYYEYISDWERLSEVENMAQGWSGRSNVTLTHEVKLPNSEVWQEFEDSQFIVDGTVNFRIKLINDELGGNAGIRRSRILVYAKADEVEIKWPKNIKTKVIPITK